METTKSISQPDDPELRSQISDFLPRKVLIVEDNRTVAKDFAQYFYKILATRNHEASTMVDLTYCIEDALEILINYHMEYSLVLIDIALPETREALERCEKKEEERNQYAKKLGDANDGLERRNLSKYINKLDDEILSECKTDGGIVLAENWVRLSKTINRPDDEIANLTNVDGGIELVERWREKSGALSDSSVPKVLFFTAQLNDVDRFQKKYEPRIYKCGISNPGWMLKEVGEISFLKKLLQFLQKR